jgi:hypothetical protein
MKLKTLVPKFSKIVIDTVEQAVLAVPGLVLLLLANPGPLISSIKMAIFGLLWLRIGDFVIHHAPLLYVILDTLAIFATVAGAAFAFTVDGIQAIIDVVIGLINTGGKIVNLGSEIFTGKDAVPTIDPIPIRPFPIVDFTKFLSGLASVGNATATCAPFENLYFEVSYPFRTWLNTQVCPIVRYTFDTLIYEPFQLILSPFHFDADPNGNNCNTHTGYTLCFFLQFGAILLYIVAPLHLLYWLFPPLKKLLVDLFSLALTSVKLAFALLIGLLHANFHEAKKKP